jgi:hypothetical protein
MHQRDSAQFVRKSSLAWWLKTFMMVMAYVALYALVVLILLKLDGRSRAGHWSWAEITVPTLTPLLVFSSLWFLIHYYTYPTVTEHQSVDADRMFFQHGVSARKIEDYHEIVAFRDVLLIGAYMLFMVYCAIIYNTPCTGCNTPYKLLSFGCGLVYALRAIYVVCMMYADFHWLKLMAAEIRRYQHSPRENERRLFSQVFPDLQRTGMLSYAPYIQMVCFGCTFVLALFGTIWIENEDCMVMCSKQYYSYKYLLVCIYFCEAFFVITCLLAL